MSSWRAVRQSGIVASWRGDDETVLAKGIETPGTPGFAIGLVIVAAAIALLASSLPGQPATTLEIGKFSAAKAGGPFPDGWEPLTFDKIEKHTEYSLVADNGTVAVKAVSRASASGLVRQVDIDPMQYPVVEWRWKVENILKKGDVTRKDGDDYPARLYITFRYDPDKVGFMERAKYEAIRLARGEYPPMGAITYIWESKSPVGTIVPNPYTDRVMMLVLQSGNGKAGEWVTESRNLLDDYRRAFGGDPPRVSGVAVMTDTDNTQESAIAYFGDIVFKAR